MKEVFQGIIKGCLGQAGQSILEASEWLSGHIKELGKYLNSLFNIKPNNFYSKGLHINDHSLYKGRMQL
jgi:hypothetical protein